VIAVTVAMPVTMPAVTRSDGNARLAAAIGPMVGSSASLAGHESTPCFDNQFHLNENDCHEI
jgi:hypothetical protein